MLGCLLVLRRRKMLKYLPVSRRRDMLKRLHTEV